MVIYFFSMLTFCNKYNFENDHSNCNNSIVDNICSPNLDNLTNFLNCSILSGMYEIEFDLS